MSRPRGPVPRTGTPWTEPCPKCGELHRTPKGGPACTSHSKRTGEACSNSPARGGHNVCHIHGAKSPNAIAGAKTRTLRGKVTEHAKTLADLFGELAPGEVIDPVVSLLEQVARSKFMADALEMLVLDLELEPVVVEHIDEGPRGGEVSTWGTANSALWGADHTGDAKPHVLMGMLATWVDMAAKTAKMAIDAGIAERQVQLAEGQAQRMASLVRTLVQGLLKAVLAALPEHRPVVELVWRDEVPGLLRTAIEATRPQAAA